VLAGAGAAVVTAKTSQDVKTRLLSEQFDAIIINGKMPEWNAKDSYAWIKANCSVMEGHILFTFASGVDQSEGRTFLQESTIPYLVKPFEVAELIAQTRKLLQKAQAAEAGS
jgi:DNA-binding response OmpR family regulator